MQTCVKYTSTRQVLLPLVKPLADRGAGSSWACWGGPYKSPNKYPPHSHWHQLTPCLEEFFDVSQATIFDVSVLNIYIYESLSPSLFAGNTTQDTTLETLESHS